MIIVNLKGGLGNQMFQYAFGRAFEIRNTVPVKFDQTDYPKQTLRAPGLHHFNVRLDMATETEVKQMKYPLGAISKAQRLFSQKILRRFHIGFEPELLSKRKNHYFDGFYNSAKYFEFIRPVLIEEFSLREPFSSEAGSAAQEIKKCRNAVSIHIRRGDYVDHKAASDLSYFTYAIEHMKSHVDSPVFFVFSDDIEWVKKHMVIPSVIFVSQAGIKDFEEIILMSACKHHIISASTFSWWGAWLAQHSDGITIAPRQWPLQQGLEDDIILSSWIRM